MLPQTSTSVADTVVAAIEGAALARYVYRIGEDGPDAKLSALALVCDEGRSRRPRPPSPADCCWSRPPSSPATSPAPPAAC
ncbi:hypothetical protein G7085_05850 [Tessaracoccus sp. HDW20]|uniref:hypothetical protein n=1 Tax=Tessaracoccus coleopterorum TaxID=2714950 RepID=UPI0018D3BA21|nr:hypothetical protein [Tessaracoccus coleopterorum]NHB84292.1 hypothetical protein [Tessaracoccus coleopterorum]